ncbi:trigger factor [Acidiferrimicrobium sp. IK]|uniref:trigger factor n=1 Tax=Acidiferrimicrobium sp. IK TaxID=2871700 RepID=UPI0021CB0D61|nr:trigger factor [Acidiferrimicrobium sp. IK]MCU4185508.1 trigger factor [Acidiferrimicrobium sp. IK]
MKSVIEPLEGNKVKVSVEVDAQEFEKAVDAAFKKIAREVRVPGFRPGKAPRRILEARLGKEAGRAEALRDSLPDYYARAVKEHEVDAIAPPEIDITAGEADGDVAFDAVVEVRPHLQLIGYQGLRVEIPSPVVGEDDINQHIDRLRANFAELATVERPAADGDNLTIDLKGTRDGEEVSGMTLDDYLYELGSGSLLPEVDEHLQGAKAGDTITFSSESTSSEVTIEVKEVKEKVLPDVTDEWASDASEFDTVDELRADIVKRLTTVKKMQASMALRNGTIEALVALVDEAPPKALVDAEVERQAHDLGHRLEAQGATIAQWLAATGQSEQDVIAELQAAAEPAVKADLALRAVAEAERIEPSEDDVEAELARIAGQYQLSVDDVRAQLERAEQMPAVRSDLKKSKALEWLIEHVELVDAEGNPVDRAALELDGAALLSDTDVSDTPDAEEAPEAPEASEDTPAAGPVESGEA